MCLRGIVGKGTWESGLELLAGMFPQAAVATICVFLLLLHSIVVIVNAIITTVFGRNSTLALSVAIQFSIATANVAPAPNWLLQFCLSQLPVVIDI